MNKKNKRLITLLFLAALFLLFFMMSVVMSDGSILLALPNFIRWYEIYIYILPSIGCILLREDKREETLGEASVREIAEILLCIPLIYLVDRNPLWPEELTALYIFVIAAKLFLSALITLLIHKLISLSLDHRKLLIAAFDAQKYTALVCLVFLIRLLGDMKKTTSPWASVWYLMDYSDGFGSRFFPGQLLSFLRRGSFISSSYLALYVAAALALVILLCGLLFNAFMHSLKEEHRLAGLFLLSLYIAMPANLEALWDYDSLGLTESFVLLFLMLLVLLFEAMKQPLIKYLLAALLSVVCMACYQGYLFLYFPILFCLLLHEYMEKRGKTQLLGGLFVCLCTGCSFILFQFFHSISYDSVEALREAVAMRTDMEVLPEVFDLEFNRPMSYHWHAFFEGNIVRGGSWQMREISYTTLFLLSPLLLLFTAAWRKLFSATREEKLWRNQYFWLLLSDCIVLVQFVLTMDWGRWYIAVLSVQFFQILYLCYKGDAAAMQLLDVLDRFVRRHTVLCVFVVLYLSGITRVEGAVQMKLASRLWKAVHKILETVKMI